MQNHRKIQIAYKKLQTISMKGKLEEIQINQIKHTKRRLQIIFMKGKLKEIQNKSNQT